MGTPSSQTVFGVPLSHRHCYLDNYNWPSAAFKDEVGAFMISVGTPEPRHLVITGSAGVGKTHLGVGLYRWGVRKWGTMLCKYIHVPDFFHEVKNQFNTEGEDPFLDVVDARALIILDDLLGRNPSAWELDNILYRLINTAHSNNSAVVVTTNANPAQIGHVLKPHEMSRLFQNAVHLEVTGEDKRL